MPTSPGPLLAALTALWERTRLHVPDLPPIRPTVSPTSRLQSHGPDRWGKDETGTVSGLVVNADVLQAGPDAVLEMMLHDAAHVLNWIRGISDTTMRGGVYHNAAFITAAEEVGLEWPADAARVKGLGYVNPRVSAEAQERHAVDVEALLQAIPDALPHLELPATSRDRSTDRLTLRCGCTPARTFRISRTVAAQGPIQCGVCKKEFSAE
ncbi:hypothetical protein [Streptomyces sp. NPDC002491]